MLFYLFLFFAISPLDASVLKKKGKEKKKN